MSNKTISQFTTITNLDERGYKMLVETSDGLYRSIDPENASGGLVRVLLTLTQAQIQAGNTTPQTLLAAQGASTLIEPVSIGVFYQHNGTNYATATHLRVHNSGNTNYQMRTSTSFVQSATSRREAMLKDDSAAANFLLDVNTALVVSLNADATNNGGEMFISALLRVIRFA